MKESVILTLGKIDVSIGLRCRVLYTLAANDVLTILANVETFHFPSVRQFPWNVRTSPHPAIAHDGGRCECNFRLREVFAVGHYRFRGRLENSPDVVIATR
jgi:hypothetical protein